jgi:uncharacterized RDD family membrane protein YckC
MNADEMIANLNKQEVIIIAGFWKRFFAFIADILILNLVVFSAFSSILSKYLNFETLFSFKDGIPFELTLILLLIGVFSFVYFTLLEYGNGKTLGMMIMGIRVEGNLSFWKCTVRNIFIIPAFPFTLFWILDPAYLIFKKRRLSDILTNTNIIVED